MASAFFGVAEVDANAVVEEITFLGDYANLAGERVEAEITEIVSIEKDAALTGVVEAGDQVGDGGFARTAGAD